MAIVYVLWLHLYVTEAMNHHRISPSSRKREMRLTENFSKGLPTVFKVNLYIISNVHNLMLDYLGVCLSSG